MLIIHCNTLALNFPVRGEDISGNPVFSILQLVSESFSIVAANVFVLISGWFGICFKWRSLFNLLFQCAFFLFGIYAVYLTATGNTPSFDGIRRCLLMSENAWFVKSYLGLYIVSPILNAFIHTVDRTTFKTTLILFFGFQLIYGWLSQGAQFINYGLSAWSFMGLYLLAQYIKTYQPAYSKLAKKYDILIYLSISVLLSITCTMACCFNEPGVLMRILEYTSPVVILSAVYLLLYFSKIHIQNNAINWIAKSCFAVFLMHFIIWDKVVRPVILNIDREFSGIIELLLLFSVLCTFYISAILLDKIRLFIWNKFLIKLYNKSTFANIDSSVL